MVAAITKIKEAEDAGDALVAKATEQAQEIARAAAVTARERAKALRDEARQKRAAILEKAKLEAEKQCAPLDEAAKGALARISQPDAAAFNAAVDRLVKKLAS